MWRWEMKIGKGPILILPRIYSKYVHVDGRLENEGRGVPVEWYPVTQGENIVESEPVQIR